MYFDGGYNVVIGGGNVQSEYISTINECGNRIVPNIDLNLTLTWLGSASIDIGVTIQNNNTYDYSGYLKVYVNEMASTLGWVYSNGYAPVSSAFLDYAYNESVYVTAGGTWQHDTIWVGNQHSDGYGHTFSNITRGNTIIIGAIYNSEWHQNYSDPPDSSPFNAYYVDDAAGVWIDVPPNVPGDSIPANLATLVNPSIDLRWKCLDTNYFDILTYDVYFGETNPPPFVANSTSKIYDPGDMDFSSTYYWQIVAKDGHGDSSTSPVWSFTTRFLGDFNKDNNLNITDVIYLINHLFRAYPPPNPIEVGDVNCNGQISVDDIVYLINYLFRSGPIPHC